MILSASRRTDIPCYYSDWFVNRIQAGYVLTRNPMNNAQISKVILSPDVLDCIVFWTKDAENIMDKLPILDSIGYKYYFQFTLTPYDNNIEQNLRPKEEIEKNFTELSKIIGKDKVLWRYDPIILNDVLNVDYHKRKFTRLCKKLSPYTNSVTISFVDTYTKQKMTNIREITDSEIIELSIFISKTANEYALTVKSCCEKMDLTPFGIEKASCINTSVIEKICGGSLNIKNDKNQREGCGCVESIDIGSYNTCLSGCVYCYANNSYDTTLKRYNSHNPQANILIGEIQPNEKITEKKVMSNINYQIKL